MANPALDLAKRNAQYAQDTGGALQDRYGAIQDNQQNIANFHGGTAADYYNQLITSGGYTPEQARNIIGQQGSGGVPGLDQLGSLSPAEAKSNMLTDTQKSTIAGDPFHATDYLNSGQIRESTGNDLAAQKTAVGDEQTNLNAAVDPSKLALSSRYAGDTSGQVASTKADLSKTTGSSALGLDPNFSKQYEMSPEQQQAIVSDATRDVGNVSQANLEDIERKQNAAGIGPMGLAARQQQFARQASTDEAAAATKARIAASAEAAGRVKDVEGLRLGAAQNQAGLQTGAEEYSGTQGLGALQDVESKRLASESDISNKKLQAATTGGAAGVQNAQNTTATDIGTQTNIRDAEVAAQAAAEKEAQSRGQTVALNDQSTTQANNNTNYTRGAAANQALSERYGTVGNEENAQKNIGGQGIQNEQQIAQGAATNSGAQQLGAFGTTTGATGQAANTETTAQNKPGVGSQILGGVLGGASAAASFFDEGGIATEPTNAVLGESGPEAVYRLPQGPQDSRPIGGTDAPPQDPFGRDSMYTPPSALSSRYGNTAPPAAFDPGASQMAQYQADMQSKAELGAPPSDQGASGSFMQPAPAGSTQNQTQATARPQPQANKQNQSAAQSQPSAPTAYGGLAAQPTPAGQPSNSNAATAQAGEAAVRAAQAAQVTQLRGAQPSARQPLGQPPAGSTNTATGIPAGPSNTQNQLQAAPAPANTQNQQAAAPALTQRYGSAVPPASPSAPAPAPPPQAQQSTSRDQQAGGRFLDEGGVITDPTEATLGESGPEAIYKLPAVSPSAAAPPPGSPTMAAPWRRDLAAAGAIAGGVQRGMSARYGSPGAPPPQTQPNPTIVNQPTRAVLGNDGPEAVVPLNHPGKRMRPGAFASMPALTSRYGAAA